MTKKQNESDLPVIITCIDTTNASETALRYACYKAKNHGLSVKILAVMESSHKNLIFASRAIGNEKRKQLETHLKKLIDSNYEETGITPEISIREGDIVVEIIREIKATSNCAMLVFGKSHNSLSDNTVLPKMTQKIGNKINVPITIVPENLSKDFLQKLV
jgi:nucleotide-binding universal stress UspA family protein